MKLRTRVLVSYVLLSIIPLLVVTFGSWLRISTFVTDQLRISAVSSIQRVASSLQAEFRRLDTAMVAVFADSGVRRIVTRRDPGQPSDQLADLEYLLAVVTTHQGTPAQMARLKLLVPSGRLYSNQKVNLISAESSPTVAEAVAAQSSDRAFFAFRTPGHRYHEIPDQEPVDIISFGRHIPASVVDSQPAGAVMADVLTETLALVVQRASLLDQGYFVLRQEGTPLLAVRLDAGIAEVSAAPADRSEMLRLAPVPVFRDIDIEGYVPFNEVFYRNVAWRNDMIWLIVVVAILCYATAVVVTRSSTRRIVDLSRAMRELDHRSPPDIRPSGGDEVAELEEGFRQLLQRLRLSLKKTYSAGVRARQAEISLLQAQVNPHFLYNTLEMLSGVARTADPARMERVIRTMADYYRFSLQGGRSVVTLGEELQHVTRYVEIENERRHNTITLVVSVPDDCLDALLPRITMQPLVENAIIHGIAHKEVPKGTVMISARLNGGRVEISVRDDGVGIAPERLASLGARRRSSEHDAFGVRNVKERLESVYEDAAALRVETERGVGTRVTIFVPDPERAGTLSALQARALLS